MDLAATMAYARVILFILSIIVDINTTPVQIQEFNNSTVLSKERSTDVYFLTTNDFIEARKNSHLNMSNYEEVLVTHNPPGVDGLKLTPSLITLPVKTHVSNLTDTPPDKKSSYVSPSTMMLTTTDTIDIENGPHNMSNNEEVTLSSPGVDSSTFISSWFTLPFETHVSNTTSAPPDENSTYVSFSTMMLATIDSIDGLHNISNNEEVTLSSPGVDSSTFISSWFTLPFETHVSNTTSAPPDENSTYVSPSTMMLTTTDTIDIENGPHNISNNEEVTFKPSGVDGTTLIPSWFILPVETHVSNTISGQPSKANSTDVVSSSTTISILDPVEAGKNITLVAPRDTEVTHHINGLNISSLYSVTVKAHNNNTSGGPFIENKTHLYNSEIILTTTTDFADTEYSTFNMSNYKDVCGRQLMPMPRIVGGDTVSFGEWPWQISLRHKKKYIHKCGAVLFNENWAITTAHCVKNISMNDIHLILGKNDFSINDEPYGFLVRKLQTVIMHPKYNTYAMENDLALLRFDEPVKFQPNILPVCIPEENSNFEGLSAHITGWGALYYGGLSPVVLQEVTVPILNNSVCETMFRAAGYVKKIPDTFICAGLKDGGYDACKGDSGGPMVVQRPDNRWVLAGIIAWGMRCGEPNSPGVYMRISKFKDWINTIIYQS